MREVLAVLIFQLLSLSLYGQSSLSGYYSSNFARGGLYLTQIEIRTDSTFLYQMVGDTYNDKAHGRVRLQRNGHLMLDFIGNDSLTSNLNYDSLSRPKGFVINEHDLFEITHNGMTKTTDYKMTKLKRYIFFGEHRMVKRKYFLRKRTSGHWIDW